MSKPNSETRCEERTQKGSAKPRCIKFKGHDADPDSSHWATHAGKDIVWQVHTIPPLVQQ